MDSTIICFQHCAKRVYCSEIPETCPVCQTDLFSKEFKISPFRWEDNIFVLLKVTQCLNVYCRYPYPFVKASQYPCAVILKPTDGDFLKSVYSE